MENYLLAQDLWDIVEATTEPPRPEGNVVEFKAWRKNNAAALHAILISCGVDILPKIKEIHSAKIVWDKLATMYGPDNSSNILADSSSNNVPDLALHLLHRYPGTAIVPNMYDSSPLFALATKSSAFRSGNHLVFWKNWIYASIDIQSAHSTNEIQIKIHNPVLRLLDRLPTNLLKLLGIKQIYEMKLLHHQARQLLNQMLSQIKQRNDYYVKEAIFQAIKGGIVEFIDRILGVIPSLLYTTDTMGRNILFYSVLHRQAKIFKLLYRLSEKGSITHSQDSSRSTILHMAAMLEPSSTRDRIPGEALKMQSELQWFKEVERICPLWIHEIRNDRNMTAKELFTHNHKDMLKEGEKWMKDTAASFTVIGTLIITIMFTAAFTVPGIVTSTHLEDEFSLSLPLKMITGQFTLFFSIMTMMIAFCAGVFIVLHGKLWMAIPVICLAIVTACPFASMLLTLVGIMLKQMLTYGLGRRYLRRLF